MADPVYLVDGSGYIFRAFYAVAPLTTKSGFPTNALFGFTKMLKRLLLEAKSDNVAVVFDSGRETFRKEIYSDYKANRTAPPEELIKQFPYFTKIAEARSKMGSIQMTPELINDPQAFAKFQQVQGEMGSALSRLMMITENYPNLKADTRFADLQAQLEGTENRLAVARNRYIQSVQSYNTTIRQFPTVLTAKMFGYGTKQNFTVENEASVKTAPVVDFDK